MPLQNRVSPYGEICFSPHRGTLMGNRGRLHDDRRQLVRPYLGKRWIICLLEFRGRHQSVMRPGRYTELFFLDEATALAAGHRPCAQCQYGRFQAFMRCWKNGNEQPEATLEQTDTTLHTERTGKNVRLQRLDELPDGVVVEYDHRPCLVYGGRLWTWSFAGYHDPQTVAPATLVRTLTPASIVRAIGAGFRPGVHASAQADG